MINSYILPEVTVNEATIEQMDITTTHEEPSLASAVEEDAIEVNNITVRYRAYSQRPTSLKEHMLGFLKNRTFKYYTTFDALSGVSFSVPRGKFLGIIGSNGAGKSTLLKTLRGVIAPVEGSIVMRGSIDSLIKLGAGFDRELNAIENIYLYGSLYRIPREEIKERIPRILEFSELEEFSLTPVKYYSSGMFARLGFSCAIDMNPDILLVDEVLAVGDERFRAKCSKEMDKFLDSGKTIVMVSHGINALQKKSDIMGVLSKGKLLYYGDPAEAVKIYRDDEKYQTSLDGKRF